MKRFLQFSLFFIFSVVLLQCTTNEKSEDKQKDAERNLPKLKQTELKETSIQIQGINKETQLENQTGILVVRFILEDSQKNILDKLPNFRIRGQKNFEIDNSPTNIRKDAVHIFILPIGKYSISSVYSINDKGEYQFDKPFIPNNFIVAPGKVNYVGDVRVWVEEESKGGSVYAQKLKLKLPANNDETITVIQDKLKDLLSKYPLERSIISLQE